MRNLLPAKAAHLDVCTHLDFHHVDAGRQLGRNFQILLGVAQRATESGNAFSEDVGDFDQGVALGQCALRVEDDGSIALIERPFRHAVGQGREGREASCAEEEGKEEVFHRPTKVRISF